MLQVGVYSKVRLAVTGWNWYVFLKEEEPVIWVDLLYMY